MIKPFLRKLALKDTCIHVTCLTVHYFFEYYSYSTEFLNGERVLIHSFMIIGRTFSWMIQTWKLHLPVVQTQRKKR